MICEICKKEIEENEICPYCYSKNNKENIYDYNQVSLKYNQYLEEMTLENFGKNVGGFLYTNYGAVYLYNSNGGDFLKKVNNTTSFINILFYLESFIVIITLILINIFLKDAYVFILDSIVIFISIVIFFVTNLFCFLKTGGKNYLTIKDERLAICVYSDSIDLFNDKTKELIINIPKEQIKEFSIEPLKHNSEFMSYKLCVKSDYDIIKKKNKKKFNSFKEKLFDLGIYIDDKNKLLFLKQEFEKILGISDKTYYFVKTIDNNYN